MYRDVTLRRRRAIARRKRMIKNLLFFYLRKNHGKLTSYCNLNTAVPILQLYYSGADLQADFRLSRETIASLIAVLWREIDHGWSRDIEVLVFLYWLAHAASYRVVSRAFAIPKSSVHDIVHRVSRAVRGIVSSVITLPTGDELEMVGAGFADILGSPCFTVVVGAMGGCHVHIKAPSSDAESYLNSRLFHSIHLQVICDHQGRFIDVFVGYPGSAHNSEVLQNSSVYTEGLYPPAGRCIFGGGGYPCISEPIQLLTPYPEPVQNAVQAHFNSKLSLASNVVERAVGMLKTRWRSLFFKALEVSHVFAPEVVTCCAVLHNLCIDNGDTFEPDVFDEDDISPVTPVNTELVSGEAVRESLASAVLATQPSETADGDSV